MAPEHRPSLNALRAFEATVGLSSMTGAAEELSVTHGAVSRHIKSLEEMFSIPLLLARRPLHSSDAGRCPPHHRTVARIRVDRIERRTAAARAADAVLLLDDHDGVAHPARRCIPRAASGHRAALQHELYRIDFVRDEISVAIRNSMIEPHRT